VIRIDLAVIRIDKEGTADHLDQVVARLGGAGRLRGQDSPGCRLGVGGVGLASAPTSLTVRPHHFDDKQLAGAQVAGEARPVTARAFDAERLDRPESLGPRQQPPIARPRRGELDLTESPPELIERHRHVQIAVRADADRHPDRLQPCNPRHRPSPL
jgi:hypothetical protein